MILPLPGGFVKKEALTVAEAAFTVTPDTPEKYRPLAAEIVLPLLDLLRVRSALEEDTWHIDHYL